MGVVNPIAFPLKVVCVIIKIGWAAHQVNRLRNKRGDVRDKREEKTTKLILTQMRIDCIMGKATY